MLVNHQVLSWQVYAQATSVNGLLGAGWAGYGLSKIAKPAWTWLENTLLRNAANVGADAMTWAGRDPSYRSKLAMDIGAPPVGDFDAHHVLPVEFGRDFARLGIDANAPKFGTWVPRAEHQGWSSE